MNKKNKKECWNVHDVTHTVPACVWPQPPVRQIRLIIGTGVFQQVHSVLSRCQM